jgi:hypothetical protein
MDTSVCTDFLFTKTQRERFTIVESIRVSVLSMI